MIILLTLILKIGGLLALAASPRVLVALVESVTGAPAGVQAMDYVERGQVIKLAPGDSVVLGYFKSCVQETITGGVVTVGADQSTVQGGRVERANVMCAGNDKMQSAGEVNTSGGMIFRGEPHSALQRTTNRPQFIVYGTSPIVEVGAPGTLVIERIDQAERQREIVFGRDQLVHGAFLDLATAGAVLAAGGLYRAKAGRQEVIFKVDRAARPGAAPVISRLLRLQP